MSRSLVRQFETESRIAARPSQVVPLIQASPLAWTAASTRSSSSSSAKRNRTWFSTTSFSTSQPWSSTMPVRELAGARARALDELGDARPAERAKRGVDGEPACPPRELRRPVHLVAGGSRSVDEVLGRETHRGAVGVRMRDEREAAVVGDVEPLVCVGRPGVGLLEPGQVASSGEAAAQSPNAPSTCSQAPAPAQSAAISASGSKAPVFTSPACAQTMVGPLDAAKCRLQRVGPHPALRVDVETARRIAPEPEQPKRAVDRHVALCRR